MNLNYQSIFLLNFFVCIKVGAFADSPPENLYEGTIVSESDETSLDELKKNNVKTIAVFYAPVSFFFFMLCDVIYSFASGVRIAGSLYLHTQL